MLADRRFDEVDELHALIDAFEPGIVKDQFHALVSALSEQQLRELLIRMRGLRRQITDRSGFVV